VLLVHVLVAVNCVVRMVLLVAEAVPFGNAFSTIQWPPLLIGLLVVIPFVVMFLAFSLLVFFWAAVYHFSLQTEKSPLEHIRLPLVVVNLLVSGAAVILAIVFAVGESSHWSLPVEESIVQSIAGFIAAVEVITALGFVVYGTLLFRTL